MKALTLWQPWATFVAEGIKCNETRSWYTSYRGPLAIHAARRSPHFTYSKAWVDLFERENIEIPMVFPRGCVIALCELVDCAQILRKAQIPPEPELSFGDYSIGRYIWTLREPLPLFIPIPAKGQQRLWDWDDLKYEKEVVTQRGAK